MDREHFSTSMSAHMSFMSPQMLQLKYPVRDQITECVL